MGNKGWIFIEDVVKQPVREKSSGESVLIWSFYPLANLPKSPIELAQSRWLSLGDGNDETLQPS